MCHYYLCARFFHSFVVNTRCFIISWLPIQYISCLFIYHLSCLLLFDSVLDALAQQIRLELPNGVRQTLPCLTAAHWQSLANTVRLFQLYVYCSVSHWEHIVLVIL